MISNRPIRACLTPISALDVTIKVFNKEIKVKLEK